MIMFCFFFMIIDLYFLIPVVIAQIFTPTAGLAIPTEITISKANAEIETQPLKQKQGNVRSNLKSSTIFYAYHSLNY